MVRSLIMADLDGMNGEMRKEGLAWDQDVQLGKIQAWLRTCKRTTPSQIRRLQVGMADGVASGYWPMKIGGNLVTKLMCL